MPHSFDGNDCIFSKGTAGHALGTWRISCHKEALISIHYDTFECDTNGRCENDTIVIGWYAWFAGLFVVLLGALFGSMLIHQCPPPPFVIYHHARNATFRAAV